MGLFWGFKSGHVEPSAGRFVSRLYGIHLWRWFVGVSVVERTEGEDFLGRKPQPDKEAKRNG